MADLFKTLGRMFVVISLVVFGVQHFIYGGFVATLVPAFMPGRLFWAYFVGVAFVAAAAGIFTRMLARPAATMLGVMFFLFVVLLHIPRIVGNSNNGTISGQVRGTHIEGSIDGAGCRYTFAGDRM